MKRIIACILCLFLLAGSAVAAPGDAIILRDGMNDYTSGVRSIFPWDGGVCVSTYDGFYLYKLGDAAPTHIDWMDDNDFYGIEPSEDEDYTRYVTTDDIADLRRRRGVPKRRGRDRVRERLALSPRL